MYGSFSKLWINTYALLLNHSDRDQWCIQAVSTKSVCEHSTIQAIGIGLDIGICFSAVEKYFSEFNDFIMSENLPNSLSAYYPLNITELRLSFDIKRGLKASNPQELGINWGDQVWSPKIFQSSKLLWDEPSGEHLGINWRFWAHFSPSSFPTQTVLCIIDSLLVDKSKLIIKSSFRRRSHNIDGIARLKNSYLQGKFCVNFQHVWNTNLQSPVRLPIPPLF